MTETTFDLGDVKRLAAALDAFDLEDQDRDALRAIFALAGQAAAGDNENEVSGFALDAADGLLLPAISHANIGGSLFASFQWGARKAGGEVQPIGY